MDSCAGFSDQRARMPGEFPAILIIVDDPPPVDAANPHVVQRAGTVESGMSRHRKNFPN